MSKQIFKQDGKKIQEITMIQDKNLLKRMLDKNFQPDIAAGIFSDLIKNQKKMLINSLMNKKIHIIQN